MIRASALNVLAMTRSAELCERINPMLASLDGVRAETRIGDLHSVNGKLAGGSVMSLVARHDKGIVVAVTSNVAHADTAALALEVARTFADRR